MAVEVDQEIIVSPGWNAVWLAVDPIDGDGNQRSVESVFSHNDITHVATLRSPVDSEEFISEATEDPYNDELWKMWRKSSELDNDTLLTIAGYQAYLVRSDASGDISLTISGEARFETFDWSEDAYNLVGFQLTGSISFNSFFAGFTDTFPTNRIFQLKANGDWEGVNGTDLMESGVAYWIFCEGPTSFMGPIRVSFDGYDWLDFGANTDLTIADPQGLTGTETIDVSTREIVFKNISEAAHSPQLVKVEPTTTGNAALSDELRIYEIDPKPGELGYDVGVNGQIVDAFFDSIASGDSDFVTLGAYIHWSNGGSERENLYRLELGNNLYYWLPIVARNLSVTGGDDISGEPDYAGLWVGEVLIDEVSSVTEDGRPLSETSTTMPMRMIVHVDDTGGASLLSAVTVMQEKSADGEEQGDLVLVIENDKLDYFEGIEELSGKRVGKRIQTTSYDMPRDFTRTGQFELWTDFGYNEDYIDSPFVSAITNTDGLGYDGDLDGAIDLAIYGNYLYVTGYWSERLAIFDISDPANPTHVQSLAEGDNGITSLNSTGSGVKFVVEGDYGFLLDPVDDAIAVMDMANAVGGVPTVVSVLNHSDPNITDIDAPQDVALDGDYLYVAGWQTITVFDFSTPSSPTEVAFIKDENGGYSLLRSIRDLIVSEGYLYASAYTDDAVTIINVADPANPFLVSEIRDNVNGFQRLDGADAMLLDGNVLYVAVFREDSLTIIDVSDPANPVRLNQLLSTSNLNSATDLVLLNDVLYVAASTNNAVSAYDVADPTSISLIKRYSGGDFSGYSNGVSSIAPYGEYLFVNAYNSDAVTAIFRMNDLFRESDIRNYVNGQSSRPIILDENYHSSWPLSGSVEPGGLIETADGAPLDFDAFHRSNPFRHAFHKQHTSGYGIQRSLTMEFDLNSVGDRLTGAYSETVEGLAAFPISFVGQFTLKRVAPVAELQ
ncbi:hypothetical protein [Rubellicoccus peritrichatus]|uniref:LVIVD repeat-containing protein n=1 Tax=Rubellicoccus peritrichatus TaxID=3080537 RepID=A0AAQ3QUS2_9BACT|nr:hypothetical protein [Puniceicoccus sp. CR14]WOO40082.1 hypothetical protein RZN69_15770 [Puniceicoccus sp. CR14]